MSLNRNQLVSGYKRSIIGYDLRIKASDCFSRTYFFQKKNIEKGIFPATIDNRIWPEIDEKCELKSPFNGFNLFDIVDDSIQKISQERNATIVAFDIPNELAIDLSSTFGLLPQPLGTVKYSWKFLGYDIVDIRTQCSAMFSFSWTENEISMIFKELLIELNGYGLIQKELDAIRISSGFDKIISEHRPFVPCGVWIDIG